MIADLYTQLEFPEEVLHALVKARGEITYDAPYLFQKLSNGDGVITLKKQLGEDEDGFKMLACTLLAGFITKEKYSEKGISDTIFYDTFQCFPRFLSEHYETFGYYGFDRSWWTHRQISLKLFRIGELEFEMTNLDRELVLSVHIPSSARLSEENRHASYKQARSFFQTYFPEFKYTKIICSSWLLSPDLAKVLGETSNILAFQKDYDLIATYPPGKDFLTWVYKKEYPSYEELPEDTSLQRNLKQFLIGGGSISGACGVLKAF